MAGLARKIQLYLDKHAIHFCDENAEVVDNLVVFVANNNTIIRNDVWNYNYIQFIKVQIVDINKFDNIYIYIYIYI